MNKFMKALGFGLVKFGLVVLYFYVVFLLTSNTIGRIGQDYDNYLYIKGFVNYGAEMTAELSDSISEIDTVQYAYMVGDKEYYIEKSKKNDVAIDKTLKIYYDILEPEKNVEAGELNSVNAFYSNSLKSVANTYLFIFLSTIVLGLLWYLLDMFKYNKRVWKGLV